MELTVSMADMLRVILERFDRLEEMWREIKENMREMKQRIGALERKSNRASPVLTSPSVQPAAQPTGTPAVETATPPVQPTPQPAEPTNDQSCSLSASVSPAIIADTYPNNEATTTIDIRAKIEVMTGSVTSYQSNVAPTFSTPATVPTFNQHHLTHLIFAGLLLVRINTAGIAFYPFDPGGNM